MDKNLVSPLVLDVDLGHHSVLVVNEHEGSGCNSLEKQSALSKLCDKNMFLKYSVGVIQLHLLLHLNREINCKEV